MFILPLMTGHLFWKATILGGFIAGFYTIYMYIYIYIYLNAFSLKMSFAKFQPFFPGLSVLTPQERGSTNEDPEIDPYHRQNNVSSSQAINVTATT